MTKYNTNTNMKVTARPQFTTQIITTKKQPKKKKKHNVIKQKEPLEIK